MTRTRSGAGDDGDIPDVEDDFSDEITDDGPPPLVPDLIDLEDRHYREPFLSRADTFVIKFIMWI